MPRVAPPEDSEPWVGQYVAAEAGGIAPAATVGHQLVSEHRDAPILDRTGRGPGTWPCGPVWPTTSVRAPR